MTSPETCAWPRCRRTDITVLWYTHSLCNRCYNRLDSDNPQGDPDRKVGHYTLEEFKRILKVRNCT